ncbi:unnamed protein product [Fraxinus pennsylvanica]|uniref:Uncharacterized protein n=1 Tax=Fraxinus pennsylvanica TaxID=56036 RepID=A0AAD1ZC14_9LAMI|nr:unnamed protein product [Fraxinus pennsylvanica]
MALTSVKMTEEVWLACMTHALSTETEEIVGLLLGDIQAILILSIMFSRHNTPMMVELDLKHVKLSFLFDLLVLDKSNDRPEQFDFKSGFLGAIQGHLNHLRNGDVTALIWGALPQPRSDRRKDRVEINPEQLVAASAHAEISFPTMLTFL